MLKSIKRRDGGSASSEERTFPGEATKIDTIADFKVVPSASYQRDLFVSEPQLQTDDYEPVGIKTQALLELALPRQAKEIRKYRPGKS